MGSSTSPMPNCPPNSPDLNLIELLWGYVGAKVQARGANCLEAIKQAVVEELRSVHVHVLVILYKSMPKRKAQVVELGGDKTKY